MQERSGAHEAGQGTYYNMCASVMSVMQTKASFKLHGNTYLLACMPPSMPATMPLLCRLAFSCYLFALLPLLSWPSSQVDESLATWSWKVPRQGRCCMTFLTIAFG